MIRIDNTDDLSGHSEKCVVKNNLDGSVCVLCFCEDTPKQELKADDEMTAEEVLEFIIEDEEEPQE